METKDYPIFSGKVLGVAAIVEENGEYVTLIDYMTPKDELTEEDRKKDMPLGMLSVFVEEHRDKMAKTLQERVKRAAVPMRVDPSVILYADIRTSFGQLNEGEYGEGQVARTYELEVINAKSQAGGDMFASMAEHFDRTSHSGMKYIKILKRE
jgi:hypothetical protein